jgi:hypothetical protein
MSDSPTDTIAGQRLHHDDAPVTASKEIKPARSLSAEAVTIHRRAQPAPA